MEIKNKAILLVEDEQITALMSRKVLENHGFKVIHTYTGEDAVETVDTNSDIDLILMDIDLGDGIYGTEAAEQILSRHDLPLVFLSSHTEPEIVNKTKSITNYGYVVKNTGEVVLIAAIEMALKLFESNRALRTHLSQQEHLVDILFELHNKMDIPFNELMDFAIESSVKLTMSGFAFGGLLNEDESLMTIHAWSVGAMESCSIDKNPIHFPIAEAGVWSECVRQRKPVLINDYAGHHAGKGYPSGHVPIVNFMAVPIFDGERIAAVGAVANRNTPFDASDVQVLTSLYQRLWEIIRRKGLEDTLNTSVDILTKSQEMAHIGNWFLDMENNHLFWSDEVYRIFGIKPRKFAATYETFLESVHPDDREKVHRAYSESLTGKKDLYEVEHRIVQKNSGNIRYVFEKCFHKYNEKGDLIISTGIVQDITELKQSELEISKKLNQIYKLNQELEASNEKLEQSNKLLQQTAARMNSLLDNTPAIISIFDKNEKYIEVSNTFAEQWGLTRDEIKGKTFSDLLPGETVNEFMKTIEKIQDDNKPLLKTDTIYINGEKKVYESRLFPIFNENENTSLFCSIAIDITERKQAEDRLQIITDNMFDLVALTDLQGYFTFVGKSHSLLGYHPDNLIGKNVIEMVHEDDFPYIIQAFNEWLESGLGTRRVEYRIRCFDGSYLWLETLGRFIKDENENIRELLFSSRDITERKQTEQSLLESEERFRALHNASFGGIAIHDKGIILECNRGLAEMTGYSVDELLGMDGLQLISEKTRDMVMNNILAGYEKPYEAIGVRKNKDEYPLRLEARNIPYKGKNVRVVEFRDITEQKQAEKNIMMLLKESHHRVKNNMNTIYGLLMLQAERNENSDTVSILTNAAGQLQSMITLYDKLYRSSQYRNINIQEYFNRLINEITGLFNIHIPIEKETFIEDFVLSVDIVSPLSIIINELITNSMKYAFTGKDKGKITISATKKDTLVTLSYSDNGIGLPESFSIEESDTFGMQLVDMLVKQIKGSLKIEKGDGVRFVIEFSL